MLKMPVVVSMPELLAAEALMQLHFGASRPSLIANATTVSPSASKTKTYSQFSICLNCRSDKKNTNEIGTQTDGNEFTNKAGEALAPAPEMDLNPDVSTDVDLIKQHPLNQNNMVTPVKKEANDEWHPKKRRVIKPPSRVTHEENKNDMVPLGDGNTTVPRRVIKHMNWTSYTVATRKLLTTVFSRSVLATHSLTGKPSPAFPGKPAKKRLDPEIVRDIVQVVVERCGVPESVVRTSITTKCADEAKMLRNSLEQNKNKSLNRLKENISPL